MKLEHALSEIQFIQASIQGAQRIACVRWATTLAVGGLAVVAGVAQTRFVSNPIERPVEYFTYWALVALIAVVISGGEIVFRYLFQATPLQRRQTRHSIADFSPAVVVGGAVSLFLIAGSPQYAKVLPALWLTCFSLGIFSMRSRLPVTAYWVAGFFGLCAIVAVQSIETQFAMSGWLMGGSFGLGHAMMAGVLYFDSEEKPNGSQD